MREMGQERKRQRHDKERSKNGSSVKEVKELKKNNKGKDNVF